MRPPEQRRSPRRWQCGCGPAPILLGTTDQAGGLTIKIRDRLYQIEGRCQVRATCPRCGRVQQLMVSPPGGD